jgi:hypothetical protein
MVYFYRWINRINDKRIMAQKGLNYMITGHGPFPAYFDRFNIGKFGYVFCKCGVFRADTDHFMLNCPHTLSLREDLKMSDVSDRTLIMRDPIKKDIINKIGILVGSFFK